MEKYRKTDNLSVSVIKKVLIRLLSISPLSASLQALVLFKQNRFGNIRSYLFTLLFTNLFTLSGKGILIILFNKVYIKR